MVPNQKGYETYVGVFKENVELIERVDWDEEVQHERYSIGTFFTKKLVAAGEVEDLAAEHQSAVDQVSETETWKDKEQRIVTTFPLVSFNHNSDIDWSYLPGYTA